MPAVAVVVPAYNPGPYLRPALESVLAQTFTDWECVVVNDGSTEDLSWVDGIDKRVRLITKRNQGVSIARNVGIAATTAPWVAFLDADDLWHPTKLERQIDLASRSSAILIDCDFGVIDANGDRVDDGWRCPATTYHELLRGNYVGMSSAMVPRHALQTVGVFDVTMQGAADWDMWLRLTSVGSWKRVPEILASWRVHSSSMSADRASMLNEVSALLSKHTALALRRHDALAVEAAGVGLASQRLRLDPPSPTFTRRLRGHVAKLVRQ